MKIIETVILDQTDNQIIELPVNAIPIAFIRSADDWIMSCSVPNSNPVNKNRVFRVISSGQTFPESYNYIGSQYDVDTFMLKHLIEIL